MCMMSRDGQKLIQGHSEDRDPERAVGFQQREHLLHVSSKRWCGASLGLHSTGETFQKQNLQNRATNQGWSWKEMEGTKTILTFMGLGVEAGEIVTQCENRKGNQVETFRIQILLEVICEKIATQKFENSSEFISFGGHLLCVKGGSYPMVVN